ncbi:hypothetical protein COCMIDRAFT_95829 [Bipolaris oryzae ATCC 44560]|uniref:Developmental regulatory protein wetA n=1 Tax=Bipolaris oryzae ATCC 44560 TaxID=930090 RepID=W6Z6A3_COCMI|nr:uncharacterized protein COCMIDRAFT_95829 [Bipolaris oryzae ATCC 44560]EUC45328.1 hypothetical protein COCMIDRAFT_95829 [Bipolaris oryzae ATCC 44560]
MSMQSICNSEPEGVDLDNLFEGYVDTDLLCPFNNSSSAQSSPDELACLLGIASSNDSDIFGAKSILNRETKTVWHKALQECDQSFASPWSDYSASPSYVTSPSAAEYHSDSESLSFPGVIGSVGEQLRSMSQPCTPRPHTFRRSLEKAVAFQNHMKYRGIRNSSKTLPTKPSSITMQASYSRPYTPDLWNSQATSVDIVSKTGSEEPASLATLSEFSEHENKDSLLVQDYSQVQTLGHSLLPTNDEQYFSHYQSTTSASLATEESNTNHHNSNIDLSFSPGNTSSAVISALLTPPPSLPLANKPWIPDTTPTLGFDFSASPDLVDTSDTASWWNSESTATTYFTSQNTEFHGLGITCDPTPFNYTALPAHILPSSFTSRIPSPTSPPRKSHSHPRPRTRPNTSRPRRSRTSSSHPSSRITAANTGFVNFTPEDSRKILTGVAPSGSSKTKARREREAAERRRKLSQAAMKAVLEAGGDVERIRGLEALVV